MLGVAEEQGRLVVLVHLRLLLAVLRVGARVQVFSEVSEGLRRSERQRGRSCIFIRSLRQQGKREGLPTNTVLFWGQNDS